RSGLVDCSEVPSTVMPGSAAAGTPATPCWTDAARTMMYPLEAPNFPVACSVAVVLLVCLEPPRPAASSTKADATTAVTLTVRSYGRSCQTARRRWGNLRGGRRSALPLVVFGRACPRRRVGERRFARQRSLTAAQDACSPPSTRE